MSGIRRYPMIGKLLYVHIIRASTAAIRPTSIVTDAALKEFLIVQCTHTEVHNEKKKEGVCTLN